ncbi:entry exclusion protein [Salmonella enterica subsp. diarizonae]|nr:entry exclusion protein [Salmonella enterica subsp. diarizonae]EDS6262167.1 EexN family lipoprotein [Salmonella enterica subsp. diarizonae]
MKRIYIIILTLFFCIGITGCEDKKSVDWYVNHHEDMFAKYTECLLANSWHDDICQNARSAMNLESEKPDVKQGLADARQKLIDRNFEEGQ